MGSRVLPLEAMVSGHKPDSKRSADFRIVRPDGEPLGAGDLLKAWMTDPAIRAVLRREGFPDWPFEALQPAVPLLAGRILRSAANRNLALARKARTGLDRCPEVPGVEGLASGPRRLLRRLGRRSTWRLGLLETDPFGSHPSRVSPLLPSPGLLRADPFPWRMAGEDWILFEEQAPGDRGRLRAARRRDGNWQAVPGEMLVLPHHLSWPYPLEIGGRTYLLPESGEASEVALWRCESFPDRWTKAKVLLEGRHWHDPALVEHDGIWWLFVSAGGDCPHDHSAELHAFWSPSPSTVPFLPHDLNPLSVSVAGSRPAGRPLHLEGSLFRPAQDCRSGYGSGVLLRRVEELSPRSWRESTVARVAPPTGSTGLHTLNFLPGLGWVVDTI